MDSKSFKTINKHQEAYGLEMSQRDIEKELQNISMGHPTNRCSSNMRCFEIYVDYVTLR